MNRITTSLLLALVVLPLSVHANDYSMATNAVMKGMVPWRVAIFLIDHNIEGLEERYQAIKALVKYQAPGLAPHLKVYAADSDKSIRTATFWPLYKNGERSFAIDLLKREIANGNVAAASVFYSPNLIGSDYKLALSKNDNEFHHLVEAVAMDKAGNPQIRIHAAVHLTQIGMKAEALSVANAIFRTTSGDSHTHKMAEWCAKLANE